MDATESALLIFSGNSPVVDGFDVRTLMGLSGLTFIEAFVKYLQNQWKLPTTGMLPVLASLISGVLLNLMLAIYLHLDLSSAVVTGAFTGVLASGWHQVQT